MDIFKVISNVFVQNGLVFSFMLIGLITLITYRISALTKGKIHGSAIAIFAGLILAYIGGITTGGSKGLASIPLFPDVVSMVTIGAGGLYLCCGPCYRCGTWCII